MNKNLTILYIYYLLLLLYQYYILYNTKISKECNICINNKYINNLTILFILLFTILGLIIIINVLPKKNYNIIHIFIIRLLYILIAIIHILILYIINLLLLEKEIIEKNYNIKCNCLGSYYYLSNTYQLKVLNYISIFINLIILIKLINYIYIIEENNIVKSKTTNNIVKINLPKKNSVENQNITISSLDANISSINTINTADFSRNNHDISADTMNSNPNNIDINEVRMVNPNPNNIDINNVRMINPNISADNMDSNPNDIDINNVRMINPNISADSQATEPDMYNPQTGRIISNPARDWINMANRLG